MNKNKKLVIVTAGSRGIGASIVRELIKTYNVVFTYRTNKELAETLVSELNNNSYFCQCYPCDVTNPDEVKSFCNLLIENHGIPYGIVNNAGITDNKLLIHTEINEWQNVIDTNLNSLFYFNRFLLDSMILEGEGCIINISSIAGLRGNIGQTSYSASKAAQIGMTKSLSKEVGMFNVRVNCIAPGLIETDMTATIPPKTLSKFVSAVPLKKMGKPEDISKMVCFLLGEEGQYITGQTIVIDGGLSI